ncbi:hypothetical protein [Ferrimonas balearica]|uniref:hypothetical protein n=1 Tax=Ferrimonas balearica TaxID=44012 RepID=UPI001C99E148|nr:hypothetical protein [Ferrimonas balearica]MBY5993587.1 hypothetical protein [Ferrimonas balearica]
MSAFVIAPLRPLFARLRAARRAKARRQRVKQLASRVQWLDQRLPAQPEQSVQARYCSLGYGLLERGSALLVLWSERPGPALDAPLRQWHQEYDRLHTEVTA